MKEARKPKCPADCKGPFENTACEYTCHNNNKDMKKKKRIKILKRNKNY